MRMSVSHPRDGQKSSGCADMLSPTTREQAEKTALLIAEEEPPLLFDEVSGDILDWQVAKYFPEFRSFRKISEMRPHDSHTKYDWFRKLAFPDGMRLSLDFDFVLERRWDVYYRQLSSSGDMTLCDEIWEFASFGHPRPGHATEMFTGLAHLNQIWNEACSAVPANENGEALPENFEMKVLGDVLPIIMASHCSCEYPHLADWGRRAGVDFSVASYFEGVPIEHILCEAAKGRG